MVTMAPTIRISQDLYKHLKNLSGTMSKNLDRLVLGKAMPVRTTPKRKFPESNILYSAILDTWGGDKDIPKTRREILEYVNEHLKSSDEATKYPKWYDYENNLNWKSRFSVTIDHRIFSLVRSNRLRREESNLYLN